MAFNMARSVPKITLMQGGGLPTLELDIDFEGFRVGRVATAMGNFEVVDVGFDFRLCSQLHLRRRVA